jgi:hypothetical protein
MMTTTLSRWVIAALSITLLATSTAVAESPYPTTTRDGRERVQRTGSCPTGYLGKGDKCEALHQDTPRVYPRIKGASCPSGTFGSGDYCKEFR